MMDVRDQDLGKPVRRYEIVEEPEEPTEEPEEIDVPEREEELTPA